MRWYSDAARTHRRAQEHVGIAMMLMNGALIAAAERLGHARAPAEAPEIGRPSWITLLILIFAMIAPGAPRADVLSTSLIAASFDPLACGCHPVAGGAEAPTFVRLFILCWPNYACAFVVVVPAKVLHRMAVA